MSADGPDPISVAVDRIWNEWSFLLLRAAFMRARRFDEFLRIAPISRNRLADRLQGLVSAGLLARETSGRYPLYRLTPMAIDLYPFIVMLLRWAQRALEMPRPTLELLHDGDHALEPIVTCVHCGAPISAREVSFAVIPAEPASPANDEEERRPARARRFRRSGNEGSDAVPAIDAELRFALDAIGDRWSVLVLRAIFTGRRRFDSIQAGIGIARNVLADRLVRLKAHGLLFRQSYSTKPPRDEYRLTERALALHPALMLLRQWSLLWLAQPPAAIELWHRGCGQPLEVTVRCICGAAAHPHRVRVLGAASAVMQAVIND